MTHELLTELATMWGPFPKPAQPEGAPRAPSKTSPDPTPDAPLVEKLKEKKEPTLGEMNPLLFPPDLSSQPAIDALRLVSERNINHYGGVLPSSFAVAQIFAGETKLRLVVKFELDELPESKIKLLEELVAQTYGTQVRTRKNTGASPIPPHKYPSLETKSRASKKRDQSRGGRMLGWYMGSNLAEIDNAHTGLFVYRDLGETGMADYLRKHDHKDWFFKKDLVNPISGKELKTKYLVEIREAALFQTDLVEFITQVANIIGQGKKIDNPWLMYNIYNELNRLGLKRIGADAVHGLQEEISRIKRALVLPLANNELAESVGLHPESVLLVGVPGTGKTLVAECLLQEDLGVFLVPLDPLNLGRELAAPPDKKWMLPRITQVSAKTGIPVVIHLDDIENIVKDSDDNVINSALLNAMAGVRESGFYLLASTNYPEKLSPQLLQPQRFGILIYFGLCKPDARRGILDKHAWKLSRELQRELFGDSKVRESLLDALSSVTEGYTPRFLAEICTTAKSFYLQRLAKYKNQNVGLREEDIEFPFELEDWLKAFDEVDKKYNKKDIVDRDKFLKNFVQNIQGSIALAPARSTGEFNRLRKELEKIAAQAEDTEIS